MQKFCSKHFGAFLEGAAWIGMWLVVAAIPYFAIRPNFLRGTAQWYFSIFLTVLVIGIGILTLIGYGLRKK